MLVSIVIPCYKSEASIRKVIELTLAEFENLDGYDCEFILVDDCSPDNTFQSILTLSRDYQCVHGITLMRNFGQHNALMCGMNHASGDLIMGMDDDLQTHPSQIPILIAKMEEGFDVVYGIYRESKNGIIKNFTSWLNRWTAQKLLDRPKGVETSNFWLITSAVRDQVVTYRNYNPYVQALFSCVTKKIGNVPIEHHVREQGSSGYTFGKLANLWLSYFNYTVWPLRAISKIGITGAVLGFLYTIYVVVNWFLDPTVPLGWSSVMCVLLIASGLILLTLGIIGEYLGNLVLPANGRAQFIVRETTDAINKA